MLRVSHLTAPSIIATEWMNTIGPHTAKEKLQEILEAWKERGYKVIPYTRYNSQHLQSYSSTRIGIEYCLQGSAEFYTIYSDLIIILNRNKTTKKSPVYKPKKWLVTR